jgi:leucyl aminopeptidase
MYFNLKINAAKDELNLKPDSALVKFFIDTDKLEKIVDEFFLSLNYPLGKVQRKNFMDKKSDEFAYYSQTDEPSVIFVKKVKLDKHFSSDFFRNYFAGLVPSLKKKNLNSVHVVVPSFFDFKDHFENESQLLRSLLEGIHLGNYTFDHYKSDKDKPAELSFFIHSTDQKVLKNIIDVSDKLMSAVFFSRDLVNEPAVTLTPTELAARAKKELVKIGVKVTVFNKAELKKKKMNAILAVGGASDNPPCLITMHYKPNVKTKKKIALVGKGVCYDSGGLSLKPTSSMLEMKADMAGGGAVIGIIKAAAMLKLPIEIIGVVPAVENMVNGSSYKPGDVVIAASGKSIEVKDTDAEGRIVLADALHYASQQKPDEIIDFATLTGACVVALGEIAAGLFTQNDRLADDLLNSGKQTFERLWRMPFWNDYNDMIKSEIADVSNLGPRWGGAITAGKFLENFVDEKIPWAHIDLAGPAIKHKSNNYTEKYDTGFGVRLMIDYLLSF